uniref:Uncharacterized protein n=1 Tax=Avena sativa TaxID=4498 RepID=A0ACD5YFF9_AVESA
MWACSAPRGHLSQLFPPLATAHRRPSQHHLLRSSLHPHAPFLPSHRHRHPPPIHCRLTTSPSSSGTTTSEGDASQDLSALFSDESANAASGSRSRKKRLNSGASSIPSGVRLENISKLYKGLDVSWEVQRGEKVGLVGVNGAGKTTQLRIIAGLEDTDNGNIVKAKENMKIAFLSQEFEVKASRTVMEEFLTAFREDMGVKDRLDQRQSYDVDLGMVEVKIQKLMTEFGFVLEDADRFVASFSSGWKMRMSAGILICPYLMSPQITSIWTPLSGSRVALRCRICRWS